MRYNSYGQTDEFTLQVGGIMNVEFPLRAGRQFLNIFDLDL